MNYPPFIYRIVVFTTLAALVSCNTKEDISVKNINIQDSISLYGVKQYNLPQFSTLVKENIAQWAAFDDFENELTLFHNIKLEALKKNSERLLNATDSILKTIPDTLHTNSIYARLLVAKTRVAILHQEVQKTKVDSATVERYLQEMYTATDNLVLDINEKLERDTSGFKKIEEEELERQKQKRFQDSVFKAELRDANN